MHAYGVMRKERGNALLYICGTGILIINTMQGDGQRTVSFFSVLIKTTVLICAIIDEVVNDVSANE